MSAADIFGKAATDHWAEYRAVLQFRDLVVGGIPSDPSVIRKWLTARLELGDVNLEETIAETIRERDTMLSVEEKIDLLMGTDAVSVNGFRRHPDTGELSLEGRIVKAGLKEWANIAYPGTQFPGKPKDIRKGLMRFLAEKVFVPERLIGLGVKEPTRVEERIKHVRTPQGPRAAINRVEVVESAQVMFTVLVQDDFLPATAWGRVWTTGEEIGLGSDRARSDGKFDLLAWEKSR